jgi:hypothetical protein
VDISPDEKTVWNQLKAKEQSVPQVVGSLTSLREEGVQLTTRSMSLLALTEEKVLRALVSSIVKDKGEGRECVVSCLVAKATSEFLRTRRRFVRTFVSSRWFS